MNSYVGQVKTGHVAVGDTVRYQGREFIITRLYEGGRVFSVKPTRNFTDDTTAKNMASVIWKGYAEHCSIVKKFRKKIG